MVWLCLHLANWNISIYTKTETYGFDSPNGKNPVQNKLPLKRERDRERETPTVSEEDSLPMNVDICISWSYIRKLSHQNKCFGQKTYFYQSLHNHYLKRHLNFFQQDLLPILWYQWYLIASLSFNSLPATSPMCLCIIFLRIDARLMCLFLLEQSHLSPWTQEQQWAFFPVVWNCLTLPGPMK